LELGVAEFEELAAELIFSAVTNLKAYNFEEGEPVTA
jgi:hypothetical protein